MEPLPGRACGTCNVCCVALTIDDVALRKPQGYRCRHLTADKRCGIYEARPETCRIFNCGWRQLRWVREALKPDVSGVMVRVHEDREAEAGSGAAAVTFMLLTQGCLKAEGLAESISAAVAAGVPTYVNVPGPPGYTSAVGQVNDALRDVVMRKDKAGVLAILRQARAAGRRGDFQPIRL